MPNKTIDCRGVWRCSVLGYGEEGGDIQRGTEGSATALLLWEADDVHGNVKVPDPSPPPPPPPPPGRE